MTFVVCAALLGILAAWVAGLSLGAKLERRRWLQCAIVAPPHPPRLQFIKGEFFEVRKVKPHIAVAE